MGRFMANGEVNVYFDSTFPALAVRDIAGSEIILRRWKEGNPEIWSMFVAREDPGIDSAEDLLGGILAVEEPFSTSGFLLPMGTLVQQGLTATRVVSVDQPVSDNEIGNLFSGDEENTLEPVLHRIVAAGALSNEDFDELPLEAREQLAEFGRTAKAPRQLVSVRGNLDSSLVGDLKVLLTGLDEPEEGSRLLAGLKKPRNLRPCRRMPLASSWRWKR
ncbi:MAG: hypothetical protein BZY67_01130 [SAR202 cluster bacterium Io17-Chloro-G1]|nr:MAG: hypothetical protein BZY67_01130 [SAR202 cluster bacterium Io17-Chloro-G1]